MNGFLSNLRFRVPIGIATELVIYFKCLSECNLDLFISIQKRGQMAYR